MSTSDKIQIAMVVVTFLAVLAALFHKLLDDLIHGKPKLVVLEGNRVRDGDFYYYRVRVRNEGRRAANRVRAFLRTSEHPNAIYARWTGMIGQDQVAIHIPPNTEWHLDVVRESQPCTPDWAVDMMSVDRTLPDGSMAPVWGLYRLSAPAKEDPTSREHLTELLITDESKVLKKCVLMIRLARGKDVKVTVHWPDGAPPNA